MYIIMSPLIHLTMHFELRDATGSDAAYAMPPTDHLDAITKLYLMLCRIRRGLREAVDADRWISLSPYGYLLIDEVVSTE